PDIVALPVEPPRRLLAGKAVRESGFLGSRTLSPRVSEASGPEGGLPGRNKTPLHGGGVQTPYCLPTVGRIVPVFGLALAPYCVSAGCRARHRARTLSATLDRYVRLLYGCR